MRHPARTAAAVALLAGVHLAALGLALAVPLTLAGLVVQGPGIAALLRLLVLGALGVAVGWLLIGLHRRPAPDPNAVVLAQADQPRLWAEVFAVADRVKSPAPDEIRLVPTVGASVSETGTWLGLRPGTRRLDLGVPLMLGLSSEQLRGVLAHELGHHSARHSPLDTTVYRGKEALDAFVAREDAASIPGRLAGWCGRLYDIVAQPVLRSHELEADRYAAEVAGSKTVIAALAEMGPLVEAWAEFRTAYVDPGVACGLRPESVFDGFAEFLDDPVRQQHLVDYPERHPEHRPSLCERHPAMEERVAALKALTSNRQLDFSGAAEDILDDRDATLDRLEGTLLDPDELTVASWEELCRTGGRALAARNAATLAAAAAEQGIHPVDLDTLVHTLRAGRSASLMRALAPGAAGDELDELAGRLIGDVVAHQLAEAGAATFTHSWSHAPLLRSRGGEHLDPWTLAHEATRSSAGLDEFETWLRDHGVRLRGRAPEPAPPTLQAPAPTPAPAAPVPAAPVPAAPVPAPAPAPVRVSLGDPTEPAGVLAAAAPVAGTTWGTMLVSPAGISLRKVDLAEKAALTKARAAKGAALLGRTVTQPLAELTAHRRTETLSWTDITSAQFSGLEEDKGVLTLHVTKGKPRRVEFLADTEIHGDLLGALEDLLGPRLSLG